MKKNNKTIKRSLKAKHFIPKLAGMTSWQSFLLFINPGIFLSHLVSALLTTLHAGYPGRRQTPLSPWKRSSQKLISRLYHGILNCTHHVRLSIKRKASPFQYHSIPKPIGSMGRTVYLLTFTIIQVSYHHTIHIYARYIYLTIYHKQIPFIPWDPDRSMGPESLWVSTPRCEKCQTIPPWTLENSKGGLETKNLVLRKLYMHTYIYMRELYIYIFTYTYIYICPHVCIATRFLPCFIVDSPNSKKMNNPDMLDHFFGEMISIPLLYTWRH